MNKQQILDMVVSQYYKQPYRCPPTGECRYHLGGDECFISPLLYGFWQDEMEGSSVREIARKFPVPNWFSENIDFIDKLQRMHDNETIWESGFMKIAFKNLAQEYGLILIQEIAY